jgi:hypothetical protein
MRLRICKLSDRTSKRGQASTGKPSFIAPFYRFYTLNTKYAKIVFDK